MTDVRSPIFHLSFPVRSLDEAISFYVEVLGGLAGRREDNWADVALFGAQITLQHAPDDVSMPMPRTRHFGATLAWDEWDRLTSKMDAFIEPPRIDYAGTDREQAKAMICDPSGNFIELKAYRQPRAILGSLVDGTRT